MSEPDQSDVRLTASVHGYVQGVGFRWTTLTLANKLSLKGSAENKMDGTVEVIVEGPRAACEQLLGWLRGDGSHGVRRPGRVDQVSEQWSPATGQFKRFSAY